MWASGYKIYRGNLEDVIELERYLAFLSQKREARPEGGGSGLVAQHYREPRGRIPVLAHHVVVVGAHTTKCCAFAIRPYAVRD
jgi:hypothetical protein